MKIGQLHPFQRNQSKRPSCCCLLEASKQQPATQSPARCAACRSPCWFAQYSQKSPMTPWELPVLSTTSLQPIFSWFAGRDERIWEVLGFCCSANWFAKRDERIWECRVPEWERGWESSAAFLCYSRARGQGGGKAFILVLWIILLSFVNYLSSYLSMAKWCVHTNFSGTFAVVFF